MPHTGGAGSVNDREAHLPLLGMQRRANVVHSVEPGQKPSGHLAGIRGCDEEPGDEPDRNDQEESDDDSLERSLTPFVLNQKKTKGHQAGDQPTEQHGTSNSKHRAMAPPTTSARSVATETA